MVWSGSGGPAVNSGGGSPAANSGGQCVQHHSAKYMCGVVWQCVVDAPHGRGAIRVRARVR